MTDNNGIVPGYYEVTKLIIQNYDKSKSYDIKSIFYSLSFQEGIQKACIRGSALIYDTTGMLNKFPIRGEEYLTLTFKDAIGNETTQDFQVYAVSNIKIDPAGNKMSYTLNFASIGKTITEAYRIRKGYKGKISDIVQNIFNEYYDTNKPIVIEETTGNHSLIIPYMSPEQAMIFLSHRAYSDTNVSQSFHFFETKENYYFATYEFIEKEETKKRAKKEMYARMKSYTFDTKADYSGQGLLDMMTSAISLSFANRVNTIANSNENTYRRKTLELNLIEKSIDETDYIYSDVYQDYNKEIGERSTLKNTDQFIQDRFANNVNETYVLKDYALNDSYDIALRQNTHYPDIFNNKIPFMYHMRESELEMTVYGRNDLVPGNIIDLEIPEFEYLPNGDREKNKYMSGKYIVSHISSDMVEDTFTQSLTLQKLDWNGELI